MRIPASLVVLTFCAGAVSADVKAADACKAKLSPIGQEIYEAALAQHPTPSTGRSIVTDEVKKLIGEDKVSLLEGRKEGEAAGDCLKLLK